MMRQVFVMVIAATLLMFAMVGVAGAHVIELTTPGGTTHSQFLGGPGNPGHAGHHGGPSGQGHLAACDAAENNAGAGVVDFIDTRSGSCA